AEAYLAGLERRLHAGLPLGSVASVASFFVSRVDTAVDAGLGEDSPLRGRAAIANARAAYHRFRCLFSGERWERLAAAGARPQRPL
ncbi:MAG: transaldolase, partial [Pseudonocardiaceae bacterium]